LCLLQLLEEVVGAIGSGVDDSISLEMVDMADDWSNSVCILLARDTIAVNLICSNSPLDMSDSVTIELLVTL